MDDEKIYKMYENIIKIIAFGFLFVACLITALIEVNIYISLLMFGLSVVCIICLLILVIQLDKSSTVV
ncbi:MAG: hypothetical protein KAQ85_00120 [Thermodesulfovibrionia bacterium]|nr:hypothetical protein [Thermodesulfovibrionia bacterium]